MNETITNRNLFSCRAIVYQIMPCEIHGVLHGTDLSKKKLMKRIKNRGKVRTSNYRNRQKRWLNDEIECVHCGRWYGVNESRHNALYCDGADGDPLVDRNLPYPFAHLKRFKHLTLKVP